MTTFGELDPSIKSFSVITNFGCHWACPYCIVKKTGMIIPKTDVNAVLNTTRSLMENTDITFLSFSGGGDPMFPLHGKQSKERLEMYREITTAAHARNIETEMHTSYFMSNRHVESIMSSSHFDRIVYHMRPTSLTDEEALSRLTRWQSGQKVRAVYVVTDDFTEDRIKTICDYVKSSNELDELSFRQLVKPNGFTGHACEDYLESHHKRDLWYIRQDDYNNYIVNDRIYTRFSDIH